MRVDLYPNTVGLAAGSYSGSITVVTSNYGTIQVPVSLVVFGIPTPQTMLTASPPSLTLTAASGSQSATQTLTITFNTGPVLLDGGPAAPGSGLNIYWLQFSPAPGFNSAQPSYTVSASAGSLPPGRYDTAIKFTWTGGSLAVPVTFDVAPTASFPPVVSEVVNSASGAAGAIAPGEMFTIFGAGVGPAPTRVSINGVDAQVIYASAGQVNAIAPETLGTGGTANMAVISNGVAAAKWDVPLAAGAAGIFTIGSTGVGQAAVLNEDNSVNGVSNPAARGSVVQIFATGAGASAALPAKVTIGGVDAAVPYSGPAPDEIAGLVQINALVPSGIAPGAGVPISVAFGNSGSQDGVTIAVK